MFRLLTRGRLTVFMFHKVPLRPDPLMPDELSLDGFVRLLDRLTQVFRILPLQDALLGLRAGNLPRGAACITFDDGYPDWLEGVVPVLEQRQLHATFYITTGQFQGQPLWTERARRVMGEADRGPLWVDVPGHACQRLDLNGVEQRRESLKTLEVMLKYLRPGQRDAVLSRLEQDLGLRLGDVPTMPATDVRTLHGKGFAIGGHSVTHPILARCAERLAYEEIANSREHLEALMRGTVDSFAYPNGIPADDFSSEHIAMVKRAGYSSAVTTHWGAAAASSSLFQIPRFTPWGPGNLKMRLQLLRNLSHRPRILSEPAQAGKRALMVAFHFPPQAGSSGILRTLNFVKYLPQNGWQPEVLTASAHAYAEQRNDLVGSIPPDTGIRRGLALDAARHLSIAGKYSRLCALPDRWSTWWLGGVVTGLKAIREQRPDLLWSTYPISTAHMIAATLARRCDIPWVADFRDPMVSPGYPSDKLQRALWRRLEANVLDRAQRCVFTTERAAQTYRSRYPNAAEKCVVIENGYDEGAFNLVEPDRGGIADNVLLLLHSGLIYPQDRNPSAMFFALKQLLDEGALDRERLRVRFRAPHHDQEVLEFAQKAGLADIVEVAPPIPYRQAIAEMMGADVLLLFQGSNFNAQVPAKVYEYLRAQRQILAAVDSAGDTAVLLSGYGNVAIGAIEDAEALKQALRRCLIDMADPGAQAVFAANRDKVRMYSRETQTQRLADLFNALV